MQEQMGLDRTSRPFDGIKPRDNGRTGRSRLETAPTMTAATTGTLEVGARADLIAVAASGEPYASVVTGNGAVNFVMVEGHVAVG